MGEENVFSCGRVHSVSSDLHLYRCDSEFSPAGNFKIDLVPDTLSPAACCLLLLFFGPL
jgi:hypothetical protein